MARTCCIKPSYELPPSGVVEVMTVTNQELFFKTEDEYGQAGFADVPRASFLSLSAGTPRRP